MTNKFNIAIIGAGAAGSGVAYRLWSRLGTDASITIYDKKVHAGGRAWDINWAGTRIEVGGSVLHSSGKYTMDIMKFTGSKEGASGLSVDGKNETYAFFAGTAQAPTWQCEAKYRSLPIVTHTSLSSMALNIVKHVGVASSLKVTNAATKMAKQWEQVYDIVEQSPTESPQELLKALKLEDATKHTLDDYLTKLGCNRKLIDNVVVPIVHNMYNQGGEIGALAGLVGLAGAGLAGGYLFAVDGGNWSIYQKLLDKIGANQQFNTEVVKIDLTDESGQTSYRLTTSNGDIATYDAVVLAAPLALANITITRGGAQAYNMTSYPYQQVYTTLVVGDLNPDYFGLGADKADRRSKQLRQHLPSTFFTADSAGVPFKSIGITGLAPAYSNARIYKIFSADHIITQAELAEIFTNIHDIYRFEWPGAYPQIRPDIEHLPFRIDQGLYYACAFETAAGAIEVETVGGYNSADLLIRDYKLN